MEGTSVESTNDAPNTVDWSDIAYGGSDPSTIDWKKVTDWLTGQLKTPAGALTGVTALGTLLGGWNKPATPPGWKGTVGENKYTASRAGPPITFAPRTSYGEAPRVATSNDVVYAPRGSAPPVSSALAPVSAPAAAPAPASDDSGYDPEKSSPGAAAGGLMGLARGGRALPPRYLRGETDGMADKLPSSIDGRQPAKLSHGEFVIPADVVSHLGNGNSDAGAKVLYKMMDRVRQARTGTKQQGKRINPEKFTPGGIASGYAGGGAVAFQTGGTTGTTTTTPTAPVTRESNLSSWVGPYIADFMDKGQALSGMGYTPYMGPLTAGIAPLQQQAFQGFGNMQMPGQFGAATNMMMQAGQRAGQMGYGPSTFGNFYQPTQAFQPGQFTSGFGYQAGSTPQFGNQFQAPGAYRPSTDFTQGIGAGQYQAGSFSPGFNYQPNQITTGLGPVGSVSDYMSPYMSGVSDIESREAQRQADIASTARGAKYAQAGAFGGARQAIENAEAQRNLATQIGDIRSRGLQSAYDRALQQRAQEAQMGMTAQQATEAGRQFGAERGAQFGLEAQKAGEASRQFGAQFGQQGLGQLLQARQAQEQAQQFGAQQGMQAAQLQAQYGLSAQQAQEAARQFNAGQTLSAAQLQAQFGLDAQKAGEMSRQFASQQAAQQAQQAAQYGLAGAQQTEASRQFAANYGMDALRQQMAAAQGLSGLGQTEFGTQLQGLQALLGAGNVQRGAEQQAIEAERGMFEEARMWPYKQVQFMQSLIQGLPVGTSTQSSQLSPFQTAGQIGGGLTDLYNVLKKLPGFGG